MFACLRRTLRCVFRNSKNTKQLPVIAFIVLFEVCALFYAVARSHVPAPVQLREKENARYYITRVRRESRTARFSLAACLHRRSTRNDCMTESVYHPCLVLVLYESIAMAMPSWMRTPHIARTELNLFILNTHDASHINPLCGVVVLVSLRQSACFFFARWLGRCRGTEKFETSISTRMLRDKTIAKLAAHSRAKPAPLSLSFSYPLFTLLEFNVMELSHFAMHLNSASPMLNKFMQFFFSPSFLGTLGIVGQKRWTRKWRAHILYVAPILRHCTKFISHICVWREWRAIAYLFPSKDGEKNIMIIVRHGDSGCLSQFSQLSMARSCACDTIATSLETD